MKTKFLLVLLFASVFAVQPATLSAQTSGKSAALKTLGATGGALLYNTYCLVGAMHDGYIVDAWKKDLTVGVLNEQISLMKTISKQYDELLESNYLDSDDSLFVTRMQKCCGLLRDEATYLVDYINDGTSYNEKQYGDARDAAWEMIEDLLGLKADDYSGSTGRATKDSSH